MGQANSRRQRAQQQSTNPNVPPEIILQMTQLHNQQYGGGLGGAGCEGGPFLPGPPQPFGPGQVPFGPGPAAFGPGPVAFGPGPAAFGPGPVAFGPGPAAFGPGPAVFGPGPAAFGPGLAAFGPGPVSAAFGPGPGSAGFGPGSASFGPGSAGFGSGSAAFGPVSAGFGPGSAAFGPGPGSAGFGPGSAAFGPGPAGFGPGSAAFGPGSAGFGTGPGSAAFGQFQSYPGPAPTFGPSQAFGSFASGGYPAFTSFAPHQFNSPPQLPAPAPFALTQGPSNGSALTQVAPPAPIYKHVSTVVQYSNNPNEFVGGSAAASAPGPLALPPPSHSSGAPLPPSLPPPQSIQNRPLPGPNVQYGSNAAHFGSNYSSGGVVSSGGFSASAPSGQLSFPSPSQYYGSTQGPNGYSGYFQGSGNSQYPGSYTLNGASGYFNNLSQAYTNNINNGSQAYTNNFNNGSQAYTNNFNNGSQAYTNNNSNLLQNSTNFSNQQHVIDSTGYEISAVNATANATTSNPYGHYSNNFSAAFPDSASGSGHNQAGPSMTITTTNGGNGGNVQDSNLLNLPTATSQTEVRRGGEYRRAQHSSMAPPKQIVVYRPSIHKSKQRFTVVA